MVSNGTPVIWVIHNRFNGQLIIYEDRKIGDLDDDNHNNQQGHRSWSNSDFQSSIRSSWKFKWNL